MESTQTDEVIKTGDERPAGADKPEPVFDGAEQAVEASVPGKFKNAEELFRAYKGLEQEFTRRCQKIKELEAENDRLQANAASEDEILSRALESDAVIDEKIRSSKRITNLIIADYLASLGRGYVAPVLKEGTGRSALTPVRKPKTLGEAKKLADLLIKGD